MGKLRRRDPSRPIPVLLAVLLFAAAGAARAQLSPGPLSRAHSHLEGAAHCLDCHAPARGVAPERCLACHTALGRRIEAGEGLHSRPGHRDCRSCHIEHHGREFALVYWGEEGMAAFRHDLTGWPLAGAHRSAACRDCHRPENQVAPRALAAGGAAPERSFLGLSPACLSCHRDEHRGQFAPESCLSCHGMTDFAAVPRFDHGETAFPLLGKHAGVACSTCHPRRPDPHRTGGDESFLQLDGVAHGSCADCHEDPHRGRLGAACASCHQPTDWRQVAPSSFDHARTGFPLVGRHAAVTCAACHAHGPAGAMAFELAHESCTDCHRDPHEGRLGAVCSSCHDPRGWARVDPDAFHHDRTRYPLRGAHRQVACRSCHPPGVPAAAAEFERCTDCHRDAHFGQLAASPGGGDCARCHEVAGFSPSTFPVAAHQETPFPLAGAHLAVACIDCHRDVAVTELPKRPRGPRGARTIQLDFASTACPTCHGDPHHGEADRFAGPDGCRACHGVDRWGDIEFDHGRTAFPLRGAHARAPCAACHRVTRSGDDVHVALAGLPTACASCHRDPHGGQFARGGRAAPCTDCHQEESWSRVTFDHERATGFPLAGAHRDVPCAACHRPVSRDGATYVQYAGLPSTCEGCHKGGAR